MMFGVSLENELDSIEAKDAKESALKRDRILTKWLDLPRQYRQPMATR